MTNYEKKNFNFHRNHSVFYFFRAIDLFPFEHNFDFTTWETSKLIRWGGLSALAISIEESFIRRNKKT